MLRSSVPSHPPLYREIIRESLSTAWHERHLWVLAILASLIQTGGIYDVILRHVQTLNERANAIQTSTAPSLFGWIWQPIAVLGNRAGIWLSLARFEGILWAAIIGLGILALSLIAQGGLVYGLGIRLRGQAPSLRACFTIGARSLWKVTAINLVTIGALWALGTCLLLPFSTPLIHQAWWISVGAIVGFALYVFGAIFLTALHLLALTQVVLQKSSVVDGLSYAIQQIKQGWLTILELGFVFFGLGILLFAGLGVALAIAGVPLMLLIFSAALLGITPLSTLGLVLGSVAVAAGVILTGAFAITVQYAAWQHLSARLTRGTATAKFHRFFHAFNRSS